MHHRSLYLLVAILCAVGLLLAACAPRATPAPAPSPKPAPGPAPAPTPSPAAKPAPAPAPAPAPVSKTKPVELKAVSLLPANNYAVWGLTWLIDRVNERAKGDMTIKYLGGPEVIPASDQAEAVRKGVVDIITISASYAAGLVPEGNVIHLSQYWPWEERARGFNDYINGIYNRKMNAYYLGHQGDSNPGFFNIYTKAQITRPQELAGKRAPGTGMIRNAIDGLGMTSVKATIAEFYIAMERGMADVVITTYVNAQLSGYDRITKYILEPGMFRSPNVILINLDAWKKLPKNLQDLMMAVQLEVEKEIQPATLKVAQNARQALLKSGLQAIQFSPEDSEWYLNRVYDTGWEEAKRLLSLEDYTKIRGFLTK